MTRESEKTPVVVNLDVTSTLTQGPAGNPIDEVQGFLGAGLADD